MGEIDIFVDGKEPAAVQARCGEEPDLALPWLARPLPLHPPPLHVARQTPRSRAMLRVILERIAAANCRRRES